MARNASASETLRESVLDRLLDDDPGSTREVPPSREEAFRRLLFAVRRDLEWLLGTRLTWVDEGLLDNDHVARSLATFGLQDFTHENITQRDAQDRLKRAIEKAIAIFEPRLTRVVVSAEGADLTERALRFRIDAVLRVEPIREPVSFDTVMEMNGQTQVREA